MNSPIDNVLNKLVAQGGRALLHSQFPDDFEFYACSFELINQLGKTDGLFHFPVMPFSMMVNGQPLISIKRTGGGHSSFFSQNFMPRQVSINGNFGRKFRILIGALSKDDKTYFDLKYKTGYGALKQMEKIISQSTKIDDKTQMPYFLIFRNFSLNQHFIVEVTDFSFQQSMENNMIWNYTLNMKVVGNERELNFKHRSLFDLVSVNVLQNSLNDAADALKEILLDEYGN